MLKRVFYITIPTAVAVFMAATLLFQISRIPRFIEVKKKFTSSEQAILDRQGLIIDEVRVNKQVRRLNWTEIEKVPPVFVEALLKAEDRRFFYHPGFDPFALLKAGIFRLLYGKVERGASTISMQMAEMVEALGGVKSQRRSISQKLLQIQKAIALELSWTKREILEAYINLIFYRSELQGIAAASFGLFDKAPTALTRPESAVIAALIRSPNATVERVRERACALLEALEFPQDCTFLSSSHMHHIEEGYRIRPFIKLAPHIAQRLSKNPKLRQMNLVRSTLDRQIQWVALHALQKHISALQSQNVNDGAVIVIENATGNILAYVGNIGSHSKSPYVDAVMASRQAGSTLKPLIYAKAFEERILTAATILEDSPLAISVTSGLYKPSNFDRAFRDLVSVRNALAASLNIPAVRALELLGVETFVQTLRDLGFTGLQRADFYGPSLALGSADVRLIEIANAYRTLANGGIWRPLRFSPELPSEEAPRRVFSQEAAFIVTDILSDRQARSSTFGLENSLSTRFWSAVKTGTSKDMRDNWCLGFSEKYTVGVWAGNFSGAPMWNVTGVQGAAPVWQEIMNYLHRNEPSGSPYTPDGVVRMPVKFTHTNAERDEVFIRGTEPVEGKVETKAEIVSKITYPLDESLIALDPDIPRENHRLFFQIAAPRGDQNLYLNDRRLGRARNFIQWEPQTGHYILELRDSHGQIVDRVRFEVRGRRLALAK